MKTMDFDLPALLAAHRDDGYELYRRYLNPQQPRVLHAIGFAPAAVVWHHHRRDDDALAAQAYGYGVGLGAFLTSALVHEPRLIPAFLRRLPHGTVRALRLSRADPDDPAAWPARLSALTRRGMVRGPAAYAHSRWLTRREQPDRGG